MKFILEINTPKARHEHDCNCCTPAESLTRHHNLPSCAFRKATLQYSELLVLSPTTRTHPLAGAAAGNGRRLR